VDRKYSGLDATNGIKNMLAKLPFGLILFIMMIIALSYYFQGHVSQVNAAPGAVTETDKRDR